MKKAKRILAILGIIILVGLYLSTLILAIFENSQTMNFFLASVAATVIVPVLIWAYSMVYRLLKKHYQIPQTTTTPETDTTSTDSDIPS